MQKTPNTKKPKLDINAVLSAADNDKSGKTFHGADKKAEALVKASKNPTGVGRKTKKDADKAKAFALYLSPEQRAEIEKAAAIMGQKSPQKWANAMILKMVAVINKGGTNKHLLIGLLNENE